MRNTIVTSQRVVGDNAAQTLVAAIARWNEYDELAILTVDDNPVDLLAALQATRIPYRAHGQALFAAHPVALQYIAALGAIADRDDGGAEAALMRPPFFALDPQDIVVALLHKDTTDIRRQRASEAREWVQKVRAERHHCTPLQTARRLIEATACAAVLADQPNGAQDLSVLYAVAGWIEVLSWREDTDFDGAILCLQREAKGSSTLQMGIEITPAVVQVLPASTPVTIACNAAIAWPGLANTQEPENRLVNAGAGGAAELRCAGHPARLVVEREVLLLRR